MGMMTSVSKAYALDAGGNVADSGDTRQVGGLVLRPALLMRKEAGFEGDSQTRSQIRARGLADGRGLSPPSARDEGRAMLLETGQTRTKADKLAAFRPRAVRRRQGMATGWALSPALGAGRGETLGLASGGSSGWGAGPDAAPERGARRARAGSGGVPFGGVTVVGSGRGRTPRPSRAELGPTRRELRLEALDDRGVHLGDARLAQVERGADLLHRQFFIII